MAVLLRHIMRMILMFEINLETKGEQNRLEFESKKKIHEKKEILKIISKNIFLK